MKYLALTVLLLLGCGSPTQPTDYRWKTGDDDAPNTPVLPPQCIPTVICKPITKGEGLQIYKCTATDPCSGDTATWQVVRAYVGQEECLGYDVRSGNTWYQPCP